MLTAGKSLVAFIIIISLMVITDAAILMDDADSVMEPSRITSSPFQPSSAVIRRRVRPTTDKEDGTG
jgi:hypothetical protein